MMQYKSNSPRQWKDGLIKCLTRRTKRVCSSEQQLEDEFSKLRQVFANNGYPAGYFDEIAKNFCDTRRREDANPATDDNQPMLKVPFVGKPSTTFSKRMRALIRSETNQDLKIVYSTTKVGDYFSLKDVTPREILSKVVYKFRCPVDPETSYIGFTTRQDSRSTCQRTRAWRYGNQLPH